jgi:hypothetical protein
VPVVDARYRLADLPAALDHLDRGPFGKIVVEMIDQRRPGTRGDAIHSLGI